MSNANDIQVGGDHYKSQAIQPWDYITSNGLGFLEGSVVKYVSRHQRKGGVEDLKKARHFLDKLIELEEAKLNGHADPRAPQPVERPRQDVQPPLAKTDPIERTLDWFVTAEQFDGAQPNLRMAALYLGLQCEELAEKLEIVMGNKGSPVVKALEAVSAEFKSGINDGMVRTAYLFNDALMFDADLDLIWVSIGASGAMGFDVPGGYGEVVRANWAKFPGGVVTRDANGKIVKPAGWTEPNLVPYIRNPVR